jgi:hypothetical protein
MLLGEELTLDRIKNGITNVTPDQFRGMREEEI